MNTNQEAMSYAAAGAAIGSIVPGVGTAIGAAVGGIVGSVVGGKKAKKAAKKAAAIQREREQNAQDATYLQMIRQARMARSGSLAASTAYGLSSSSLTSSALSSIGSQSQYSVQYTANDQRLVEKYNYYMRKAGKYAKAAQVSLATGQLLSTIAGTAGAFAGASAAATSAASAEAVPSIAGVMGPMDVSSIYNTTYASTLQSNLMNVGMWQNVASPIYQGINRYNQI